MVTLITLGTVAQTSLPLWQAQQIYFNNPIFWLGGFLPLPGLPIALGVMTASLILHLTTKPLTFLKLGSWLAHVGVIILVFSGLAAIMGLKSGYVMAPLNQPTSLWQAESPDPAQPPGAWPVRDALPFTMTLLAFEKEIHPGTTIPARFASDVVITPIGGVPFDAHITMNAPLHVQGYTIYQSSYLEQPDRPVTSIFAVVYDRTRILPYVATAILGLGLLLHLLLRSRLFASLVVFALCLASPLSHADTWDAMGTVPLQHQGRVKPLVTVADVVVPFIQGTDSADNLQTLTTWLLSPTTLTHAPQVIVADTALRQHLKLPDVPANRYALADIVTALVPLQPTVNALRAQDPAKLAGYQKNMLTLVERAETALDIARTFALLQRDFHMTPVLAKALDIPEGSASAAHILAQNDKLIAATQTMASRAKPTQTDAAVFQLAAQLRALQPEQPNTLLRFIPPAHGSSEWLSPWQAVRQQAQLDEPQAAALAQWEEFIAHPMPSTIPTTMAVPPWRLKVESAIIHYPPISWSLVPLGLALVAAFVTPRWARHLNAAGFILLSIGLIARVVILNRPPVATLYESVIFVAWFLALASLLLHTRQRPLSVLSGSMALLLVAISHGLTQGHDTMGMLPAVLNTNFWLATHVLMITGGYGASLLVGLMGLYVLFRPSLNAQNNLHTLILTALAFTATGTLLGGIWAGQSWGRFWGWDPKENGALILTLFLIGLAHARQLKPVPHRAIATVAALTPSVVALSWFGVNLLNVGLHSYGFTNGLAYGLALFCGLNISLVAFLNIQRIRP